MASSGKAWDNLSCIWLFPFDVQEMAKLHPASLKLTSPQSFLGLSEAIFIL